MLRRTISSCVIQCFSLNFVLRNSYKMFLFCECDRALQSAFYQKNLQNYRSESSSLTVSKRKSCLIVLCERNKLGAEANWFAIQKQLTNNKTLLELKLGKSLQWTILELFLIPCKPKGWKLSQLRCKGCQLTELSKVPHTE